MYEGTSHKKSKIDKIKYLLSMAGWFFIDQTIPSLTTFSV